MIINNLADENPLGGLVTFSVWRQLGDQVCTRIPLQLYP